MSMVTATLHFMDGCIFSVLDTDCAPFKVSDIR